MPTYKLFYFNGRGRAEIVRLVLAEAGVDYDDVRFEREAFMEEKAKAPFGMFPYMSVDGELLGQSMTCARYIAKEHKPELLGGGGLTEARVNEVTDAYSDLQDLLVAAHFATNDEEKEKKKAKAAPLFKALEDKLKSNNGGDGYFVGDNMTIADLRAFQIMDGIQTHRPEIPEQLPVLKAHFDRIGASPNIKAWLDKRPVTEM